MPSSDSARPIQSSVPVGRANRITSSTNDSAGCNGSSNSTENASEHAPERATRNRCAHLAVSYFDTGGSFAVAASHSRNAGSVRMASAYSRSAASSATP